MDKEKNISKIYKNEEEVTVEEKMNEIEEKLESLKESIYSMTPKCPSYPTNITFRINLLVDNIENTVYAIKSILNKYNNLKKK